MSRIIFPILTFFFWTPGNINAVMEKLDCHVKMVSCPVGIPKIAEKNECKLQRIKDIGIARMFFKLTKLGGKKITHFPIDFIPFLNQTKKAVQLYAAIDPLSSSWFSQFRTFLEIKKKIQQQLLDEFTGHTFVRERDYLNAFRMHNRLIQNVGVPHFFSNPTMYSTFTDIIYNHRYFTDDAFVQRRLSGPCPFLIKLVTHHGNVGFKWSELKEKLNPDFDFDSSLEKAIGEKDVTMDKAVESQILYLLYHEENNGLETHPDYFHPEDGQNNKLQNMTSPIAIFAQTKSFELVVVAIQLDYISTSMVYTPESDSFMWLFAKTMVNLADSNICQAIWHLSHIHLSSSVYCTLFRSHFSKLHPIYQIMRHHCEGTTLHIALAYPVLLFPEDYGHNILSISHEGYRRLAVNGYKKFKYGMLSFDSIMRSHGLESSKMEYFPFRDDGSVTWSEFKRFSNQFINIYYKSDFAVRNDKELQSFADQVSIEGKGDPYGGKGNINGFPNSFKNKKELEVFITRFLWQIAMHAVINYPLEPYGSFVPLGPTKLYNTTDGDIYSILPDRQTSLHAAGFATSLGNLRVNRIFDYYDKLQDTRLSVLVKKFHSRFHVCIQDLLARRNKKRKQSNKMGFQYIEPKWLPNSIHI